MKNMSTLYQHLRSELVPPRVKTMAAAWQVWDSVQDGVGDTIHIDYDGEYFHSMCISVALHRAAADEIIDAAYLDTAADYGAAAH